MNPATQRIKYARRLTFVSLARTRRLSFRVFRYNTAPTGPYRETASRQSRPQQGLPGEDRDIVEIRASQSGRLFQGQLARQLARKVVSARGLEASNHLSSEIARYARSGGRLLAVRDRQASWPLPSDYFHRSGCRGLDLAHHAVDLAAYTCPTHLLVARTARSGDRDSVDGKSLQSRPTGMPDVTVPERPTMGHLGGATSVVRSRLVDSGVCRAKSRAQSPARPPASPRQQRDLQARTAALQETCKHQRVRPASIALLEGRPEGTLEDRASYSARACAEARATWPDQAVAPHHRPPHR